jgi:hypothetical protein
MATGMVENQGKPAVSSIGVMALKLVIATLLMIGGALLLAL